MIKNFIWDFDGTLFDSYPILLDSIMRALSEAGIKADPTDVYRLLKEQSSKEVAEKYQLDFAAFSDTFHQYEAADSRVPEAFPGTKETLAAIVANGGKNYIMTHRTIASTKELLAGEDLAGFFEEIVGTEADFPRKPDPSAINYLVSQHRLEPQQTVMIGDRELDILAGERAGVKTCFFDLDHFLPELTADYIVYGMSEITQKIK